MTVLLLQAFIVSNLVAPTWPITLANIMLIIQVLGCYQVRVVEWSGLHSQCAADVSGPVLPITAAKLTSIGIQS